MCGIAQFRARLELAEPRPVERHRRPAGRASIADRARRVANSHDPVLWTTLPAVAYPVLSFVGQWTLGGPLVLADAALAPPGESGVLAFFWLWLGSASGLFVLSGISSRGRWPLFVMVGLYTLLLHYPAWLRGRVVALLATGGEGHDVKGWWGSVIYCGMLTLSVWVPLWATWALFTFDHARVLDWIVDGFRWYAAIIGAI